VYQLTILMYRSTLSNLGTTAVEWVGNKFRKRVS
jgi:hypothetical protein